MNKNEYFLSEKERKKIRKMDLTKLLILLAGIVLAALGGGFLYAELTSLVINKERFYKRGSGYWVSMCNGKPCTPQDPPNPNYLYAKAGTGLTGCQQLVMDMQKAGHNVGAFDVTGSAQTGDCHVFAREGIDKGQFVFHRAAGNTAYASQLNDYFR